MVKKMKLDAADRKIVEALISDARMSLKDLAAHAGLSSPGVSERIRRLQDRGIVRGFSAEIDLKALGYSLQAIVRIRPLPGKLHIVQQLIQDIPEFCECDKVTGKTVLLRVSRFQASRTLMASSTKSRTRRKPARLS